MKTSPHRRLVAPALAFVAALAFAGSAFAQTSDSAGAEALFREGRTLMTSGDIAGACAKFRESNRLDPAVGTVFNIADCEEKLGHLARAWTLFQEVMQKLPASDDRHGIAEGRAKALEPRLPRLRITLAANAPPGTRVQRDGVELGDASLGSSLPVDPGMHRLRVSAPGRLVKKTTVTLREGEELTLALEPGGSEPQPRILPLPLDKEDGSGQKTLGYVVGGVGVAGLITGIIAGVVVLGDKSTVDASCDENKRCTREGLDAAKQGKTFGVITTVGLVTGAVGLGAGTYLVLSAAPSAAPETREARATLVANF